MNGDGIITLDPKVGSNEIIIIAALEGVMKNRYFALAFVGIAAFGLTASFPSIAANAGGVDSFKESIDLTVKIAGVLGAVLFFGYKAISGRDNYTRVHAVAVLKQMNFFTSPAHVFASIVVAPLPKEGSVA